MRQEFADILTARDFKRHIPHTFTVPEACTSLYIHFHFAPPRVGNIQNMLTLTLFDPNGFRGAGHRHGDTHEVTITSIAATPGYLAGPLPPGEWTVQIDTHMILPGADCPYTLTVSAETGAAEAGVTGTGEAPAAQYSVPVPRFDLVANSIPGWYRGDLHAHTIHSDAAWDVADLVAGAAKAGLDFVTLTDHNTTSPLAQMAAQATPALLTMGGMELTTFWGHAVCLGAGEWIDWRVDVAGEQMRRIAQAQYDQDNIFIIAHPQDEGDPICTGCRWVYPQMRPGPARYVEVWNGRWDGTDPREKNEGSLGLWYDWLNAGHRLTATAGSDAHGPAHLGAGVGFNVVYAQELSQQGILDGLRSGRVYLSAGPVLAFSARTDDGQHAEIGGTLAAGAKTIVQASWQAAPQNAHLRLICKGEVVAEQSVDSEGEAMWVSVAEPGQWYVLELRRDDGWMWGLTNPIFFE